MSQSAPPDVDDLYRRAQRRVGATVAGKWQLGRLLGVGGTAAVYAAQHRNGKHVAVKILHASLAPNPDAVERFLDEAHAANKVGHSGVVSVLDDTTTDDGCAVLVMELLEGETLDARLAASPNGLGVLDVLFVADRVLDVLVAAHQRGIVHRDIKPENVFLTRDGNVKLLDFGIARLTETRRTLRTQAGSTMGTPAFMAPEQARGRWDDIDARTDLWSVGATMFVALSGRLVHEAETMNEELLAAMTRPAPALSGVVPGVSKRVAEIVDRALAFESRDRYTDARAMQVAVHTAFLQLGGEAYVFAHAEDGEGTRNSSSPTTHRPVTTSRAPRMLGADRVFGKRAATALLVLVPLTGIIVAALSRSNPSHEVARSVAATPRAPLPVEGASAPQPAPALSVEPVQAESSSTAEGSLSAPVDARRGRRPKRSGSAASAAPQSVSSPPATTPSLPAAPAASSPVDPLSRRK